MRITEDVQEAVDESGVAEGMVLVSAMHITAGVWVNDDEPGILEDALEWLDKLAPPSWREPGTDVGRELLPDDGDYRHHRGGEDNGDAHFKNLLVHHQVVLPITAGRLDLGPWQQVFYAEFDGGRRKRLVIKVIGRVDVRPVRLASFTYATYRGSPRNWRPTSTRLEATALVQSPRGLVVDFRLERDTTKSEVPGAVLRGGEQRAGDPAAPERRRRPEGIDVQRLAGREPGWRAPCAAGSAASGAAARQERARRPMPAYAAARSAPSHTG